MNEEEKENQIPTGKCETCFHQKTCFAYKTLCHILKTSHQNIVRQFPTHENKQVYVNLNSEVKECPFYEKRKEENIG